MKNKTNKMDCTNNIYLLHMINTNNQYEKKFKLIDDNKNIYIVTIKKKSECTCKSNMEDKIICDHIYFIIIKVMNNEFVKNTYNNNELLQLYNNIPLYMNNNILYDDIICDNDYDCVEQIYNKTCPICLNIINGINDKLDYCRHGCGKSIHMLCFAIWNKYNPYEKYKCLFCRTNWVSYEHMKYDIINDNSSDWVSHEHINDNINDNINENENTNNENINNTNIIYDYNKLTVKKLKALCKDNNLPTCGNKKQLINRLDELYIN